MGKFAPNDTLDAMLDEIATCDRMDVVSDESTPTDLSNSLANVSLTPGDGNGDFTIADGDTNGRKITVTAQDEVSILATGAANHVVLSLSGVIKYVTTGDGQTLTAGGTVDFPAFKITNSDPT